MTGLEPLIPLGAWAWEAYGKDAVASIFKRWAKNAEDMKKAGWEKVEWHRAAERYRQKMRELYGTMQIFGMGGPVPLHDVYTDVYVLSKVSAQRRHTIEQLKQYGGVSGRPDDERRLAGAEIVRANRRLYLLGQPGAGKTTFLKYIVQQSVAGAIDAVPIFVELRGWAGKGDLLEFITEQFAICSFPDARPFIEKLLEDGKAIVLFDGLDEVVMEGGARDTVVSAIRNFANTYDQSKIVVTCRTAANEYLFERFTYTELADFTTAQQRTFVNNWFRNDATKGESFWKEFEQEHNSGLRELGNRPLLLTMLCLTFEETQSFPSRRAELYQEAIDALLKRWDSTRNIKRDVIYRHLSHKRKVQLLAHIAALNFRDGKQFMARHELGRTIANYWRTLPTSEQSDEFDADVVVRAIEAQHGLIVERAANIYSFSHLTFQEFLTAQYIAQRASSGKTLEGLLSRADDRRWREVFLLTSSLLEPEQADQFFHLWLKSLEQHIANDHECKALFHWIDGQCRQHGLPQSAHRIGFLVLLVLHDATNQAQLLVQHLQALVSNYPDLARELDLDRALDRARELDLDRALARARDLDRDLARDLARALDRALDRARELDRDLARDRALARARDRALARARDRARDLARALDRAYSGLRLYKRLTGASGEEDWPKLWDSADRHKEAGQVHINTRMLKTIDTYLATIPLLLDCLDLAAVSDRQGIIQRLFLPPQADQPTTAEDSLF